MYEPDSIDEHSVAITDAYLAKRPFSMVGTNVFGERVKTLHFWFRLPIYIAKANQEARTYRKLFAL